MLFINYRHFILLLLLFIDNCEQQKIKLYPIISDKCTICSNCTLDGILQSGPMQRVNQSFERFDYISNFNVIVTNSSILLPLYLTIKGSNYVIFID